MAKAFLVCIFEELFCERLCRDAEDYCSIRQAHSDIGTRGDCGMHFLTDTTLATNRAIQQPGREQVLRRVV
jgi:hypothetical protein